MFLGNTLRGTYHEWWWVPPPLNYSVFVSSFPEDVVCLVLLLLLLLVLLEQCHLGDVNIVAPRMAVPQGKGSFIFGIKDAYN